MTVFWWLVASAIAAWVTATVAGHGSRTGTLLRRNHRGLDVPTGGGIAVASGLVCGLAFLEILGVLRPAAFPALNSGFAARAATLALAFGLLGLWDDIAAGPERGWRAHVAAARKRRATSGAIKLVAGGALTVLAVASRREGIPILVLDVVVVGLLTNLWNLFDVRPGRAGKMYLIASVPLFVFSGVMKAPLIVAAGAVAAFLVFDLRERVMLGDAGSNLIGALVGVTVLIETSTRVRLGVAVLAVALHVLGERPGLSRLFDAVPPLRALDRAGRAPV